MYGVWAMFTRKKARNFNIKRYKGNNQVLNQHKKHTKWSEKSYTQTENQKPWTISSYKRAARKLHNAQRQFLRDGFVRIWTFFHYTIFVSLSLVTHTHEHTHTKRMSWCKTFLRFFCLNSFSRHFSIHSTHVVSTQLSTHIFTMNDNNYWFSCSQSVFNDKWWKKSGSTKNVYLSKYNKMSLFSIHIFTKSVWVKLFICVNLTAFNVVWTVSTVNSSTNHRYTQMCEWKDLVGLKYYINSIRRVNEDNTGSIF